MADILCKRCDHYFLRHGTKKCNAKNCTCPGYTAGRVNNVFRAKGEGYKNRVTRKNKGGKRVVDFKPGNEGDK